MRTLASLLLAFCLLALISGCGFKLRSERQLPVGIEQVHVSSVTARAPLLRELKNRFKVYQITAADSLNDQNAARTVDIQLLPDNLERRLLSLFSTGQVAEYELILSIRYQVTFPNQESQLVEFDITREYQDDPDEILAKSRELDLVLREMRQQAADRIIRLLTSQSGQQG